MVVVNIVNFGNFEMVVVALMVLEGTWARSYGPGEPSRGHP